MTKTFASFAVVLFMGMLVVASLAYDTELPGDGDAVDSEVEEGTAGCCHFCVCTRSMPPQCQCTDVAAKCYSGCKHCICTKSYPPQCRCLDIKHHCPKPCIVLAGVDTTI